MKVGIITINGFNCGSFLQGFALKELVEDMGNEAYIINTMETGAFIRTIGVTRLSYGLRKSFNLLSAWKNLKTSTYPCHYDAVIIGSDIVWGEKVKSRCSDKFFGINLSTEKKIAYAPCCAETIYDMLSNKQIRGIRSMDSLSARDEKTAELIEKVTGKKPPIVMDPTFLVNWKKYEIPTKIDNFILIYSYGGKTKEMIIKAKQLSQETGMKIISVPNYIHWCDVCIPASPFEFLGFMKRAEYIITDTFHGTAFSLIYRKPFVSFPHSHKVEFLLDSFGIEYNELFDSYTEIDDLMKKKKEFSKKYLEDAIKKEENENI